MKAAPIDIKFKSRDHDKFASGQPDFGPETTPCAQRHLFFKMVCSSCSHNFDVPVYCGSRFCPVCSVRRRNRVRNRLQHLVKNCDHPKGHGYKHLTLTISNQANLAGMTKEIVASFRKLRNRQYWKNNVDGGAYVLEITGNPGNWHVHIHIVMMSRFMPFDRLLGLWMKVSSGRGVYIQQIPPSAVIGYLTKYITKSDISDDLQEEMNDELHDKRLFNPFGTWHTLAKTYVQPKHVCPECGNSGFMPFDLIYGLSPQAFYKDVAQVCTKTD